MYDLTLNFTIPIDNVAVQIDVEIKDPNGLSLVSIFFHHIGMVTFILRYIYIIYISLQNQTFTPDYFYKEGFQGIVNVWDISPLQDL